MQAFQYKAVSKDGASVRGVIEAYDEFEAVAKIKETCSIVLKVEPVKEKRERIDLNEPLWVSEKVLSLVSSQFAILLRAGLPATRTVEIIMEQTTDRLMKKILRQVAEDVEAGYSMAQSFETRGKKIPTTFIETIRAGEESGTLEISFEKLAKYYEKSFTIKNKVRSAMMYPAFLCVLAVIVITIVLGKVVPTVLGTILELGGEVPLLTRILMAMSSFCQHWWWLMLIVLCVIIGGFFFYGKTENGRLNLAKLSLRLPVLGKVNTMKAASQFANTMTTLLASGLPMTRAMGITGKVIDNYAVGLTVGAAITGIEEGKRLGAVMQTNPYLPPLLNEMAGVGEESGSLEETLDTIGIYYDREVEQATSRALSMLEPIITVVMGIVIAFIMLALYMPMFSMYAAM